MSLAAKVGQAVVYAVIGVLVGELVAIFLREPSDGVSVLFLVGGEGAARDHDLLVASGDEGKAGRRATMVRVSDVLLDEGDKLGLIGFLGGGAGCGFFGCGGLAFRPLRVGCSAGSSAGALLRVACQFADLVNDRTEVGFQID